MGVDLPKDGATLERAYDDPRGVTAAFNRNLLDRLVRELGAGIDTEAFRHRALWSPTLAKRPDVIQRVMQVWQEQKALPPIPLGPSREALLAEVRAATHR